MHLMLRLQQLSTREAEIRLTLTLSTLAGYVLAPSIFLDAHITLRTAHYFLHSFEVLLRYFLLFLLKLFTCHSFVILLKAFRTELILAPRLPTIHLF